MVQKVLWVVQPVVPEQEVDLMAQLNQVALGESLTMVEVEVLPVVQLVVVV